MKYISGNIHESLTKIRWFKINSDGFNWINCKEGFRFNDISNNGDWDKYTEVVNLKTGDIIGLRFFKISPLYYAYCYLECLISNSIKIKYKLESIISKDLIEHNNSLFIDITKSMEREEKINKLLII